MSCGSYTGAVPSIGCCGEGQTCISPVVESLNISDYADDSPLHAPDVVGPALRTGWWDFEINAENPSLGSNVEIWLGFLYEGTNIFALSPIRLLNSSGGHVAAHFLVDDLS